MKGIKNLMIAMFFLIMATSLFSQNANWINYYGSLQVTCFANQGDILWIGTDNGLLKFNKTTYEKYLYTRTNSGLRYNAISSLAIDNEGILWVGSFLFSEPYAWSYPRSLHKFVGNIWTEITLPNYNPDPINRLMGVTCMAFDENNTLWIGMDKVFNYINGSWDEIPGTYNCSSLAFDSNGRLWIGEERYDIPDSNYYGCLLVYDVVSQILTNINYMPVMKLIVDDNNRVWFSSENSINSYFDSTLTEFNSTNSQIPDEYINDFCLDETGVLWFVTMHWLGKFNGTLLNLIPSPNDQQDYTSLSKLFVDLNASIWIGNVNYNENSRELIHWENDEYEILTTSTTGILSNYINDIHIDSEDNVWVSDGYSYLVKFDGNTWSVHQGGTFSTSIEWGLMDSDSMNNIWIPTNISLLKYNGEEWIIYNSSNSPLPPDGIITLTVDNDDNVWVGTHDAGLFKFDGLEWTMYNTLSGLPSDYIYCIAIDNNNDVWVSTINALCKFDGNSWITYNSTNSLIPLHCYIYKIVFDSNNILYGVSNSMSNWVSTPQLIMFSGVEWRIIDLAVNVIYGGKALFCDSGNKVWISRFSGDFQAPATGIALFDGVSFSYIDTSNSFLQTNHVRCAVLSNNGNIWIGTSDGITVYNPTGIVNNNDDTSSCTLRTVSNYPNPFHISTKIRFQLTSNENVQLNVYNIKGQLVKKLNQGLMSKGHHEIIWDGKNDAGKSLSSGVYIYRLSSGVRSETGKMILIK